MDSILKIFTLILLPFLVGIWLPESEQASASGYHIDVEFNPDRLDGRFTGGFGEQTCHSCHFDYDLNMDGGSLTIKGVPDSYQPGSKYTVKVTVESVHLENGGFQMTARFEDGRQAGEFEWCGDHLKYTPSISDNVKYLQHTLDSTLPSGDREVSWRFTWMAPESGPGKIIFNIAANAGNDDDSAFGDRIYVKELISVPKQEDDQP
jgi:hypothetical protein